MNKVKLQQIRELYNLVLGGLIALESEKKESASCINETIFLGKWLKRVKKQKIFPKSLSAEIDYFLELYNSKRMSSGLSSTFYQIKRELKLQINAFLAPNLSDKSNFESAIKVLSENGWSVSLPIANDPKTNEPYRPKSRKEIFTTKWYWKNAFDTNQKLAKELSIFVVSDPQKVIDCLYDFGFILTKGLFSSDNEGNDYHQFIMFPDNNYKGTIAFPYQY